MYGCHDKQLSTLYFTDGKREIDFVLAYEESEDESVNLREEFHTHLHAQGIETEIEDKTESFDGKTYFVKIHAPWKVVAKYAEIFNIKMPVKVFQTLHKKSHSFVPRYTFSPRRRTVFEKMKHHDQGGARRSSFSYFYFASDKFCYNTDLIPDEPRDFCIPFHRPCEEHCFEQYEDECFSRAQRSYIVWQILNGVSSDVDHSNITSYEKGITHLLRKNIYTAAYPLHDGPSGCGRFKPGQEIFSDRRVLYSEWARFSCMFKIQPLDKIRRYFGDRVGLFFAWMSFCTKMLSPLALIGLFIICYGIASVENSPGSTEVCDIHGLGNVTMCPACSRYCPYYKLSKKCSTIAIHHIFDNHLSLAYSSIVVIWAFLVLKFWKREEARLLWMWDLSYHPEQIFETPKCECRANVQFGQLGCTMVFLVLLLADVAFAVVIYQLAVNFALSLTAHSVWMTEMPFAVCFIASAIDVICIILLDKLYVMITFWLTHFEHWHTQHSFEKNLVKKAFLLQFVNTYSSFVYIAFFKGKFARFPGDTRIYFDLQEDECQLGNCFVQVSIHLGIFIIGKCIFYPLFSWFCWNIRHKLYVSYKLSGIKVEEKLLSASRWEQDYLLESWNYKTMLFDEYLSQVMQFGMMTLFIVAFPPASFFAFVHNLIKLRIDALKCVTGYQRPVAFRVKNFGAWNTILHAIIVFSVIINAFFVSFATETVPRHVFKLWFSCNQDLLGYHNFSLSYFNVSDFPHGEAPINPGLPNVTVCRYKRFLTLLSSVTKSNILNSESLMMLAARLVLVIVWQHALFGIAALIFCCVSSVPHDIENKKHQEAKLENEMLSELIRAKSKCVFCVPVIQLHGIHEDSE